MTKGADSKSTRRGLTRIEKLPPGVIMVTLWFMGMVLFLCLAIVLHAVASVLVELYVEG